MTVPAPRQRADESHGGSDLAGLEQGLHRLQAELEAEVDEREGELAAAIDGLTELSGMVGGAARLPLEVSSRRIQELIEEVRRLRGLLADLHEGSRSPRTGPARRPGRAFRPQARPHTRNSRPTRAVAAVALACLMLGAGGFVARLALEHPSTATRPPPPASPTISTNRLFARSPVALLSGLPGNYTFDGGTVPQQDQVTAALAASGFDWYLIPQTITIHIVANAPAEATPGNIWISPDLLDSGRYSWGFVQHEYGHQVDFFLLTDPMRAILKAVLGATAWCYGGTIGFNNVDGLPHSQYGCERFASTLAWAYWPFADNSMEPLNKSAESAGLAPAKFRALLGVMIGASNSIGSASV